MSTGTNRERIEQNNLKLEEIKNQVSNLPDYQDIEPIYALSKLNIVPTLPAFLSAGYTVKNATSYVDNYIMLSPIDLSGSIPNSYFYLCKINNGEMIKISEHSTMNVYNDYYAIIGSDEQYIYYAKRYNGYGESRRNTYKYRVSKTTNKAETIGDYDYGSFGDSKSIQFVNPNKYFVIGTNVIKFTTTSGFPKIGTISGTFIDKDISLDSSYKKLYIITETSGDFSIINATLSVACYGFSMERDLAFCTDGKIRKMTSNFTISDDIVGTHNFNTYVKCLGDTYYCCGNKLYLFDRDLFSFTDVGTGVCDITLSAFIQTSDCMLIEESTKEIGFSYNKNLYYYDIQKSQVKSSDLLLGKTAYTPDFIKISGSMPNNGELNYTPSTEVQTIPAGYTSGGTILAVDTSIDENIIPENIKSGVTILGVTGTFEATPEVQEQVETLTQENNVLTQENEQLTTTVDESNAIAEDILGTTV